jgi:hypothetical protein
MEYSVKFQHSVRVYRDWLRVTQQIQKNSSLMFHRKHRMDMPEPEYHIFVNFREFFEFLLDHDLQ